jgi:glycosyltransferase involved in cell wall biosynthesis
MSATPRVSVVIPAFNTAPYIAATIDSALAQTHPPCDVTVVDDGSTDDTAAIVRRYSGWVKLVRQRNRGAGAARNRGAREARGECFVFLDGDDLLEPQALERQLAIFARHPDSGFVAGDGVKFAGDRSIATTLLHLPEFEVQPRDRADGIVHGRFYRQIIRWNPLTSSGQALIPRAAYERIGGYVEALRGSEDYDMWMRLARHFPVTFHAGAVLRYRYRESSMSGASDERAIRWEIWAAAAARRHLRDCPPEVRPVLEQKLADLVAEGTHDAYALGRAGQRARGFDYLWRMWRAVPTSPLPPRYALALAVPEKALAAMLTAVRSVTRRNM